MESKNPDIIGRLKNGKIGVLATDTIYGLVASALLDEAVSKVYRVRKRDTKKPCIILISSIEELEFFGVDIDSHGKEKLKSIWPGKVSIVFQCKNEKFAYLHRGTESLAFRLPNDQRLISILKQTGPLIAPSANPEGKPPARTIAQAKEYFGDDVDFYIDSGEVNGAPSALLEFLDGNFKEIPRNF